jgi:serine/threonine protein kinase
MTKADSFQKLLHGSNNVPEAAPSGSSAQANLNNYKLDKVLGQGSYAIVKLAVEKTSGKKVAIKTYEKYRLIDPRKMKNVRREISLLESMDHPNIIKLHQHLETTKQVIHLLIRNKN